MISFINWSALRKVDSAKYSDDDPIEEPRKDRIYNQVEIADSPVWLILKPAVEKLDQDLYAEAKVMFQSARQAALEEDEAWGSSEAQMAVEGEIVCFWNLEYWEETLELAQLYTESNRGRIQEAFGERILGNLYFNLPDYGTTVGGIFYRGARRQRGVYSRTVRTDRLAGIAHLEKARSVLLAHGTNVYGKFVKN
jgi:hypothetical protein